MKVETSACDRKFIHFKLLISCSSLILRNRHSVVIPRTAQHKVPQPHHFNESASDYYRGTFQIYIMQPIETHTALQVCVMLPSTYTIGKLPLCILVILLYIKEILSRGGILMFHYLIVHFSCACSLFSIASDNLLNLSHSFEKLSS